MSAGLATLSALLTTRRPDLARGLAVEATVDPGCGFDAMRFEATFAGLSRRLGTDAVGGSAMVTADLGHSWSIAEWGIDELGRAVLLVAGIARIPTSEHAAWVDGCYRTGAPRERSAVLRALALLPEPARFLAIALDAGRTNTQPIFEAIACENPYPAAYFPDASFNQLTMKAVFTDVALARILGLMSRRTAELARMATDFVAERRAAGRPVPADLALLVDP